MPFQPLPRRVHSSSEEGFALVGLIVAIFIILLTLSVAAPTVVRALRREREVEAVHRANAYVNAIRRYHLKTNTYPGSIEQLEKTNNIRYLREKYTNPMTGKADWRLIKVGENKTSVKGFFGQPLAGLNTTGVGGSSSAASSGGATTGSTNGSAPNTSGSGLGGGSSFGGSSFGGENSGGGGAASAGAGMTPTSAGSDSGSPAFGSPSAAGSNVSSSTSGSSTTPSGSGGLGNNSASSSSGGGASFLGVGLPTGGEAILVVNEKTTYSEWEFLYDPRIEQLRSKVSLFGGGMSSTSSSSLGALSGSQSSPATNSNTLSPMPAPSNAPQ